MEKNRYLRIVFLLNFSISFMFCIFATIEAYYTNKEEYWFSIAHVFSVSCIAFFAVLLILNVISWIMYKIKISTVYFTFLIGTFLYFYIQGNYIPRNYGVLDGSLILWEAYSGYAIASICLLIFFIGFGIILYKKFQCKLLAIGKFIAIFVFLIQLTTIGTLYIQDLFVPIKANEETYILTEKNMLNMSKDNNVIIFVLDGYDTWDFVDVLESDYEKQSQIFEDFTFYIDTLGGYPSTRASMPLILTGKWYENKQTYSDFLKLAYETSDVFKSLANQNYNVSVYTYDRYLGPDKSIFSNLLVGGYTIGSKKEFAKTIYKLIAFNYMPHQFKKYFQVDTSVFSKQKASNISYDVYNDDVQRFANKITEEMIVSEDGNVFKLYHLAGNHPPYTFDGDLLSERGKEYTYYDEAKGNNKLIDMYIKELKEKGIYDNTTIVIMADHGHGTAERNSYNQTPMFMIKNAGVSKEFTISDTKMSYGYLEDIWSALINGEIVDEAFIEKYANIQRRFLYYNWDNTWKRDYLPSMLEFYTLDKAYETENLVSSGVVYTTKGVDYSYSLGTELEFINGESAYSYVKSGISLGIVCKKANMFFEITEEDFDNIEVELEIESGGKYGALSIYVNDMHIAEKVYEDNNKIKFIIPHEYMDDNQINLVFEQVYDGTINPEFVRTSLIISKMKLSNSQSAFEFKEQCDIPQYKIGDIIYFADIYKDNRAVLRNGFGDMEAGGTWTKGKVSYLRLNLEEIKTDIVANMKYITFNGEQNIKIYIEDDLISQFIANGTEEYSFIIPNKYLNKDILDLKLEFVNAISPKELGLGEDKRELGLYLKSIELLEIE